MEEQFSCQPCGKTFSHKRSLNRHKNNVHDKLSQCDLCGKWMTSKKANHEKGCLFNQDEPKVFICEFCGKNFLNSKTFANHKTVCKSKAAGNIFVCPLCDNIFYENWRLERHFLIHKDLKLQEEQLFALGYMINTCNFKIV